MFGERLAALRNEMRLSQYQLADKLEFSRGQIGNYEQGTREPDFATLIKIADFFEVSTDYLLGRSSERVIHRVGTTETQQYNVAYFGSEKEILSDNEAVYLRESLAVYRRVR